MNDRATRYSLWSIENTRLAIAFVITVILVYWFPRLGIPVVVSRMTFLASLIMAFNSKDDCFWLSWFFLIMNAPGRLFSSSSGLTEFRLPLYNLGPGISLGFPELFLAVYLLKFFIRRRDSGFLFVKYFVFILAYGMLMLFYSMLLGTTSSNLIIAVRSIAPWAWVLLLPAVITDTEKLGRVFRMLAPFVFLTFIFTIYAQLSGNYIHNILAGESVLRSSGLAEEELIRITHAFPLSFFCMMMSLFYISYADKRYNWNYLNVILVVAGTMIFMSATRGWILAIFILLASVFFMGGSNLFKQSARVIVIFGLFFSIVGTIYPALFFQTTQALKRFLTLEQLAQGDITAGGTLMRITDRGPRIMAVFRESPVIGWGFSRTFFSHSDGHVGNQNMLMQGGILGYLAWMLPLILITRRVYTLSRMPRIRSLYGNGMLVFLLAILGSFVIHSSSMQMLGFIMLGQSSHLHWALIFTAVMVVYNDAAKSFDSAV